jgi:hypothetical protein
VRRSLAPVYQIADEMRCAVLGISHFSKNTKGHSVGERINGSIAFAAGPRVTMFAAKVNNPDRPEHSHVLARGKTNIAKAAEVGLFYQLVEHGDATRSRSPRHVRAMDGAG